ncbi:MAG TPA: sigma-54 dependent transcriptional regulator [Thermoanaerobaculaceae bacterium]|nr:sigma-54 dependent transcriptional regulator [Thermoanaerobaculaceae bacterium]HRS16435.1 sigma-54 dependent transcriptional regulator [Thermoanaerobaculaceae bacterium]
MARVLVADDEPSFRELLADILEGAGHEVVAVRDGAEALAALERGRFDLVLADQRMPRLDGLELLRRVNERVGRPPVVMLTAFGTIPEAVEAVRLGAADYLTKPLASPAALLAVVDRLLAPPAYGATSFVTENPALKEVLRLVDTVAPRDVTVLITGESGTGKELIARRLHERSGRAHGPFVAVNCAALPEALAESELFGHEKGAFTGADRMRRGRFEDAEGGTLFLDEVGELPLALQAKLLRALDGRTVRRVGGPSEIPVDVRVVAATNRNLAAEAARGAFRQDLFFRLAVVTVHLPPLRERRGDIPVLAQHLAAELAARHRLPPPDLTPEALGALQRHDWPGNVRELRNVLERAVVVRGGLPIRPEDIALPSVGGKAGHEGGIPLDRDEREREALLEALRRAGGNREQAARLLDISVRTLYYRLRRFGIS